MSGAAVGLVIAVDVAAAVSFSLMLRRFMDVTRLIYRFNARQS